MQLLFELIGDFVFSYFATADKKDPLWVRVVGCLLWVVLVGGLVLLFTAWMLGWFE